MRSPTTRQTRRIAAAWGAALAGVLAAGCGAGAPAAGEGTGAQSLYAVPRHPSPLVLYYNKQLFARHGVKAPDASWTWDTLLESARRLTAGDAFGAQAPLVIPHHLFPAVRSLGGDVLDKDRKRFVLDQPAGAGAVQWVADLMVKQKVAPPFASLAGPGDRAPFIQGRTALVPDIFPFIGTVQTGSQGTVEFDVAPVPKGPSGRINRNVAGTYILLKNSRNAPVGWELIKFLCTKETHTLVANSGTVFPARRDAAQSPEVMNPPAPAPQVNRRVFIEALENDKQIAEPALPVWDEITSLITKELVPVWNGESDARAVLQALKGPVDALLNK